MYQLYPKQLEILTIRVRSMKRGFMCLGSASFICMGPCFAAASTFPRREYRGRCKLMWILGDSSHLLAAKCVDNLCRVEPAASFSQNDLRLEKSKCLIAISTVGSITNQASVVGIGKQGNPQFWQTDVKGARLDNCG